MGEEGRGRESWGKRGGEEGGEESKGQEGSMRRFEAPSALHYIA